MDKGTAQAYAAGEATERLLRALRRWLGAYYQIGYDDERRWWAVPHGRPGHILKRDSPEELRVAMVEDRETGASRA
jgi:hypothetical protein